MDPVFSTSANTCGEVSCLGQEELFVWDGHSRSSFDGGSYHGGVVISAQGLLMVPGVGEK